MDEPQSFNHGRYHGLKVLKRGHYGTVSSITMAATGPIPPVVNLATC